MRPGPPVDLYDPDPFVLWATIAAALLFATVLGLAGRSARVAAYTLLITLLVGLTAELCAAVSLRRRRYAQSGLEPR